MRQLEAQLEEALQHSHGAAGAGSHDCAVSGGRCECPAIDTSSAAEKALQLLDRVLQVRQGGLGAAAVGVAAAAAAAACCAV